MQLVHALLLGILRYVSLYYMIRSTKEAFADNGLEHICHFQEIGCWRRFCVCKVFQLDILHDFLLILNLLFNCLHLHFDLILVEARMVTSEWVFVVSFGNSQCLHQ